MKQRAAKKVAPVNVVEKERESASCESLKKTDIFRMSTADLRELAKENGIDDADKVTGVELKKILVSKFGM